MQHYSSQAFTDIGKPAGGATITVKLAGTNTNATIYSDDGVTVKSNPFVTNNLGQFDFYAASGKYDITVTGTQITTYTLPNQVVFDPFEQTSADTSLAVHGLSVNTFSGGLAIPNGQVLAADQVTPLNPAGFTVAPVFINPFDVVENTTTTINGQNSQVNVIPFVLPFAFQVAKFYVHVSAGVASTIGDVGIYGTGGNRLVNTGGFSTASAGDQVPAITAFTLPAGYYYFAFTNSGTATLLAIPVTGFGGGVLGFYSAANASTAGVLPTTLGTLSIVSSFAIPYTLMFR